MSIDQIAAEALRLPIKERAILAGSLWESLEDPRPESEQTNEAKTLALANERNLEIETGGVQAFTHDELMAKLRQ